MFKQITFLFLGVILIGGCKKYEDDPASSRLLSVKLRMVLHTWKHSSYFNYKTNQLYSASREIPTGFSEDGGFSSSLTYLFDGHSYKLSNHKNTLTIVYNNGQQCEFKITTLTWNSFEFENDSIQISLTRK